MEKPGHMPFRQKEGTVYALPLREDVPGGRRVPVQEASRPRAVAISAWRNSSAFPNSLPFFDVKADAAPLEMGHDTAGQLKGGTAPAFLPGLIQGQ